MPPLVSHMIAAKRAAALLPSAATSEADCVGLKGGSGEFLLGATTPDIRVLTRWERDRTHFFDLGSDQHQDCVENFLVAHPHLRDPGSLDPDTLQWVCGYICHIAMDQEYITQVYRPYFGERSALGGSERANLLDRVLQYELDRREREDRDAMTEIRDALFGSAVDIDAGFIDRETLEKWRDVSASVTEHAPDWERFTYIASRHLKRAGIETEGDYQSFLTRVPELLNETVESVGQAEVEGFFEKVEARTAAVLGEYLGCR
ncbi:MAG TPA: zinc dependent phospholipase C family protein [Dehalococcoidia bacterium]|nr:zinc dependent phospholipase C family protein [Dehalococcoidia bacterium]